MNGQPEWIDPAPPSLDELRAAVMIVSPVAFLLCSFTLTSRPEPLLWCLMGCVVTPGLVAAGKLVLSRGPVIRRIAAFLFLLLNGVGLALVVKQLTT